MSKEFIEKDQIDILNKKFTKEPVFMAEYQQSDNKIKQRTYIYNKNTETYEHFTDSSINKVSVICAGQISYNRTIENHFRFGDKFDFRPEFKNLRCVLHDADLSIAGSEAMFCERYKTSGISKKSVNYAETYRNARPEFLDGIRYAGFTTLAMAGMHNLDTGVKGIFDTQNNLYKNDLLCAGIGENKGILVNINNITIGILSYAHSINHIECINEEGKQSILNIYDKAKCTKDISDLKNKGAEYIIVYYNCNVTDEQMNLGAADRKKKGIEIAEIGADTVIFMSKNTISKAVNHKTKDGRTAIIATSLGTITTYSEKIIKSSPETALLKLVLYKNTDAKITVVPSYIPCMKYNKFQGNMYGAIPTLENFNGNTVHQRLKNATEAIKKKIGSDIPINSERYVTASTYSNHQLSIREIYKLFNQNITKELSDSLDVDEKVGPIVMRKTALCPGCIAIAEENIPDRENKPYYSKSCITNNDAIEAGASFIITDTKTSFQPSIVVESADKAKDTLIKYIRQKYNTKVVCITGTVGKTTTKDMVGSVLDAYYKTLYVHGNLNTTRTMIEVISKLDEDTEYWVQEVHGGSINHAAKYSLLAQPDACMITNIGLGHLGQFNNDFDALVKGKMDIFKYLKKDGVIFLNYDNETLRNQVIKNKKVISYSTEDSSCDYYARNIKNLGNAFEFEIMDHGVAHKAKVNVQGIHNVNNAVGTYALARWAGVPSNIIISAIASFRTEGIRQNLVNCGGYNLLVDCYSSQPSSVVSGVKAIADYQVEEGAKRILVMSDLAYDLGENIEQIHRDMGKEIAEYKIDKIISYGTYTKALNEEARKGGIECIETDDVVQFQRNIIENVKPKDVVLFKGSSRNIYLEKYVFEIFGTASEDE